MWLFADIPALTPAAWSWFSFARTGTTRNNSPWNLTKALALRGVPAGAPDRRRHRSLLRLADGVAVGGPHRARLHLLPVLPHVEAHPLLRGEGQAHDAAVPPNVPARHRWREEDHGERAS